MTARTGSGGRRHGRAVQHPGARQPTGRRRTPANHRGEHRGRRGLPRWHGRPDAPDGARTRRSGRGLAAGSTARLASGPWAAPVASCVPTPGAGHPRPRGRGLRARAGACACCPTRRPSCAGSPYQPGSDPPLPRCDHRRRGRAARSRRPMPPIPSSRSCSCRPSTTLRPAPCWCTAGPGRPGAWPWLVHAALDGPCDGIRDRPRPLRGPRPPPGRPAALSSPAPLTGTPGNVLDPVVACGAS